MDNALVERTLSLARELNADAAEAFCRSSTATVVEVRDRKVDAFDRARDIGIGLRVLAGGRTGFSFTTDLSGRGLRELAASAMSVARNAEPDPFAVIPPAPAGPYPSVLTYDGALEGLSEEEQIDRAMAMEREAFGTDPRVRRIRRATTTVARSETLIANTHGAFAGYRGTIASASIEVVAEAGGESQAGWEHDVGRVYGRLDIEAVGRRAAQKALDLLGARHIDSVKAPVVLDAAVADEFLSIMAGGFSAESVQKKKSLFLGRLGEEVLSPLITIYDDGLLDGGIGSAPCDDELVPARKKAVVERGRLVQFLYNAHAAKKEGTASTGNGVRGGFRGVPGVGVTNLYIAPGVHAPGDLLAGTERGLFVTEIMGAHTANPISGDFSVGATGFWIEKGKKAYPVREITIAGNVLDLMRDVDAVGNDLRMLGRTGSPTLRVKELSISGK